jgi:hypothetical protein
MYLTPVKRIMEVINEKQCNEKNNHGIYCFVYYCSVYFPASFFSVCFDGDDFGMVEEY